MKRIILLAFFLAASISQLFAQTSNLFDVKLNGYITSAKDISKKQMTDEAVSKLVDTAMSIIDDMKNQAISEKLKSENITLKYLNGKDFPNLTEHQNADENDQKIVKFTIACYALYKKISKEFVSKIIQKSPLEMVPIIHELDMFFKFISANPANFGHGVFTEKHENTTTIFATNDAILRIMKVLLYKDLLNNNRIVYKMSRLASGFYNAAGDVSEESINKAIDSLKRNSGDDSRISIYIPKVTK